MYEALSSREHQNRYKLEAVKLSRAQLEAKEKKDRARAEGSEGLGSHFTCFTSTTVQLLTPATPGRPEYVPATYAEVPVDKRMLTDADVCQGGLSMFLLPV